jgi:hypothetical protein
VLGGFVHTQQPARPPAGRSRRLLPAQLTPQEQPPRPPAGRSRRLQLPETVASKG